MHAAPRRLAPLACALIPWPRGVRSRGLSRILNVRRTKPLIGIPADRRLMGLHPFHCVGEKYIEAVARAADAIPVLIPVAGPAGPDRGAARACRRSAADRQCLERRAASLCRAGERLRHAARFASRCPDPAAHPAGRGKRRAGARCLPRLPGNERRLRRHALAEGPRGTRARAIIARTRRIPWRCSTDRLTKSSSSPAACCTGWPERIASR